MDHSGEILRLRLIQLLLALQSGVRLGKQKMGKKETSPLIAKDEGRRLTGDICKGNALQGCKGELWVG